MGNTQSARNPTITNNQLRAAPIGASEERVPICSAEPLAIQYSLQQLPEFKNQYTIKLKDIAPVSENDLQCDVNFLYSSAETGFTKNERRRITFKRNDEGSPIVDSISQRLNELLEQTIISSKDVLDYYDTLHKYNENWIGSAWKISGASYNPPMPMWDDPIFLRNIEIYNTNYKNVINNIINNSTDRNELFKKWIAPVPANPIPPKANKITVPIKEDIDNTAINVALATESNSAIKNAEAIATAQNSYSKYRIPENSPLYDPPVEGDSFETVLIKLLKAYDYVSSQESAKRTQSFFSGSSVALDSDTIPSQYNRRLIGRYSMNSNLQKFTVPAAILSPTYTENIDYTNSIGYTFNERQKYLIDYAPLFDDNDKEELRVNFCKSLGFQPWNDNNPCGSPGDCCAPLQAVPKYSASGSASAPSTNGSGSGSASIEQFMSASASAVSTNGSGSASASASASRKKCGHSGIQLSGRTLTVSVPSPPVNIDTSNRMFTYKMSRPTNGTCKPAPTPKPTLDELYDALRPTLLKELQTTIKNNKMFDLRCPGACL